MQQLMRSHIFYLAVSCLSASPLWAESPPAVAPQEKNPADDNPAAKAEADAYVQKLIGAVIKDPSYKVRLQAAVLLGRRDDDRAVEPLIQVLNTDQHYTVRAAAAIALANLEEPRAIPHILKRMAVDTDPFVRDQATQALGMYTRDDALPWIKAAVSSEEMEVRRQAVQYLVNSPLIEIEPELLKAVGDAPPVFSLARDYILKLESADAQKVLAVGLEHRDASVRRGTVQILHVIKNAESAALVLKVYERDIEADEVRAAARAALRDLRELLPMNSFVKDATSSSDKYTRAKALRFLGVLGGTDAQKILLAALSDPDVYLRGTAVMAMQDLDDATVVPELEKLASDPANQRIVHIVRQTLKHLKSKKSPASAN